MALELSDIYDSKNGTVMGRTAGSWFRILAFYAVYYTFLACLMYFSITIYAGKMAVKDEPKIRTRTDMPGISAIPFNQITPDIDGQTNTVELTTDLSGKPSIAYSKKLAAIINSYRTKNADEMAKECKKGDSEKADTICKVAIPKVFGKNEKDTATFVNSSISTQSPVVLVTLNKIIGWYPVSTKKTAGIPGKFVKDSVAIECFQTNEYGQKLEDKFTVSPIKGNSGELYNKLGREYFPFTKKVKDLYQKPFAAFQIKSKDTVNNAFSSGKKFQFRCNVYADNISTPKPNSKDTLLSDADADLVKLNVGLVTFYIQYKATE